MKFGLYFIATIIFAYGAVYAYQNYWDDFQVALFGVEDRYVVYIGEATLAVTLADEPAERKQGLSGVKQLDDLEGKLFLFDTAELHGIWMKEMLFPIDIFWISDDLKVVHIEKDVQPESFPDVFAPTEPARYVLETNAFFADTYRVEVGDTVALPPALVPFDLKEKQLINNGALPDNR